MPNQEKQDLNVELLRILACLMVIMIHIRPFPFDGDTLRDAAIIIYVLNGPAVATFFLISGFFISKTKTLKHIYLRFLKTVILPTAVFVFVLGLIRPWIDNLDVTLLDSILSSHPLTVISEMIQGFLAFDTARFGIYADHLWYIFSYTGIMLWMPMIQALVKHDEAAPLWIILCIAAAFYTLQNLSALIILPVSITIPEAIGKPTMYAIAGWLLYSRINLLKRTSVTEASKSAHSDKLYERRFSESSEKRKTGISLSHMSLLSAAVFIIISLLLFMLQKHIYLKGIMAGLSPESLNTDYYFTSWNGMLCALQTIAFSACILLLPDTIWYRKNSGEVSSTPSPEENDMTSDIYKTLFDTTDTEAADAANADTYEAKSSTGTAAIRKNESGRQTNTVTLTVYGTIVKFLGSYTFPIYLIHYVFTNHFRALGLEKLFQTLFGKSSIGIIMYSFIYSLLIFVICSILIFVSKYCWTMIRKSIYTFRRNDDRHSKYNKP